MKRIIEVSAVDEANAIQHCFDRLLDPNQFGGPWFNGDSAEAEDWMGDVFLEAVEYFLEGLGIIYEVKEDAVEDKTNPDTPTAQDLEDFWHDR